MENDTKCSNIHINPSFGDTIKGVIHLNPKVQINMAIHVNPKMVNTFSSAGIQQRLLQNSKIEESSNTCDTVKKNVQKSVYVNPKLMQKLTNRVPEKISKDLPMPQKPIQPKILPKTPKILSSSGVNIIQASNSEKSLPSNFVAISKNKLVRIRPEAKIVSAVTSLNNVIVKSVKPELSNSLKKINPLKKINVVQKTKTRVATNSLKIASRNTVYKIDRVSAQKVKNTSENSSRKPLGTNKNLINIDGVLYRSSKSCLVKSSNSRISNSSSTKRSSIGSGKSKTNLNVSRSKKLRKNSLVNGRITKSMTSLRNSIGKLSTTGQKSNYKHVISNRVKQRSLQILRHKMCKNNQPCLLFQHFGYCAKHIDGTCPKVHDKKQVVLCKNFLQGKCLLDNCPLSHEVGPEKMPTCKYFLEGCCTRDACQYLHVKVSANTPICVPFLRGYCAKGDKCKERHTNVCPEFEKTGKCPKGKNCPYPHKSSVIAQRKTLKIHKKVNSCVKPKVSASNFVLAEISSRDENKKRYYDESDCVNENIEEKRCNLVRKINIMAAMHAASDSQTLPMEINNTEMNSQPISQDQRPKRAPIGPLPSYIPID